MNFNLQFSANKKKFQVLHICCGGLWIARAVIERRCVVAAGSGGRAHTDEHWNLSAQDVPYTHCTRIWWNNMVGPRQRAIPVYGPTQQPHVDHCFNILPIVISSFTLLLLFFFFLNQVLIEQVEKSPYLRSWLECLHNASQKNALVMRPHGIVTLQNQLWQW